MNIKERHYTKLLLVLIIMLLIAIPIAAIIKTDANAGATTQTIESFNDDYIFFIVEENITPLASIPSGSSFSIVPWIIFILATTVILCCYTIWYVTLRHNESILLNRNLNKYYLPSSNSSFFHPIRTYRNIKDAEYKAVR